MVKIVVWVVAHGREAISVVILSGHNLRSHAAGEATRVLGFVYARLECASLDLFLFFLAFGVVNGRPALLMMLVLFKKPLVDV